MRHAGDVDVEIFEALDSGRTIDGSGRVHPTVLIDAANAPAVADLARVHALEGVGDIRTEAILEGQVLLLGIRMTTPVRSAFVIAFDAEAHAELLRDVIECGELVIAHTDPLRVVEERPQWLAVDIDGAALAARLAER